MEAVMNQTIQSGPFAGTEVPKHQLGKSIEGQVFWPTRARTPLFLVVYPPEQWTVKCNATPRTELGKGMVEFRAFLVDANNVERNSASTVSIVLCRQDWEFAETIARGRLYDALGLAYVDQHDDEGLGAVERTEPFAAAATPSIASVEATEAIRIVAPTVAQTEPGTTQQTTQASLPLPSSAPAASPEKAAEDSGEVVMGSVNPQLLRVLTARCEANGKTVPRCHNDDEVRREIRNICGLRGAA
jgi:hypothetical protein